MFYATDFTITQGGGQRTEIFPHGASSFSEMRSSFSAGIFVENKGIPISGIISVEYSKRWMMTMISNELLEELQKLNRGDKLRVIQLLAGDLVSEEDTYFTPDATYEVWSPYDAPAAAETLLKMLEEDQAQNG